MPDSTHLYKSPAAYRAMMDQYNNDIARWPTPYDTQFVETRHGRTHVIVCGRADAPPLMIFHGWGANASATYTEYDVVKLGEAFRLYLPDTIGQTGRSDPHRPSTEGPAYGEWTTNVINGLGIERLYLMGISGGGYLSLKTASVLGKRVKGLLVMCTAGITPMKITSRRFLLGGLPATVWPNEKTGLGFIKAMMTPNREILPVHRAAARGMAMVFKTHRFQGAPKPLTDEELQRIKVPVMMLLGEDDVFVDVPRTVNRTQRLLPHAQVEVISKCGHMLTIDQPGLAEDRLMSFIQTI